MKQIYKTGRHEGQREPVDSVLGSRSCQSPPLSFFKLAFKNESLSEPKSPDSFQVVSADRGCHQILLISQLVWLGLCAPTGWGQALVHPHRTTQPSALAAAGLSQLLSG